ncbi:uncharacterized protein LOC129884271 [Solanum dulcamara]|uniref:uncharacterized protein LOC129884271 n=1 Tax=Solanum dulcamara TaxID=45834 RepID=UPI0024865FE1|nr:uncharacterized protein LOC129884271 [Solanum dulcamara]
MASSFKMESCTLLQDHLDAFNKLVMDLHIAELRRMRRRLHFEGEKDDETSGLFIRGHTSQQGRSKAKHRSKSLVNKKNAKCWGCHKKVRYHDGNMRTITEVHHVPDLKKNLIPLGTLDNQGYKYMSERGTMKVAKVSRDVTFDKSSILDPRKVSVELSRNKNNEQMELPVEHTKEKDQDTQVNESKDADLEEHTVNKPYTITKKGDKRQIWKPEHLIDQANMIVYAFVVAEEEIKDFKPSSPKGKKTVGCKWIYRKKKGIPEVKDEKEGIPEVEDARFKKILVAKGFSNKEGIDYNEIFSLVVKYSSIRVLLALVEQFDLELQQFDVKTAFLHSDLEETSYMEQPNEEVFVWFEIIF